MRPTAIRRLYRSSIALRSSLIPVPTASTSCSPPPIDPLAPIHPVDSLCIPLGPAPSLPIPPAPPLSDKTLLKLHDLSALLPPGPVGSKEWTTLKAEVRSMIGLVEAVRTVDTAAIDDGLKEGEVADGRIWPEKRGLEVDWRKMVEEQGAFVEARRTNVPGASKPSSEAAVQSFKGGESSPAGDAEAQAVLGLAKEGVQKVRRRGLGKNPDKEMWYYAVKAPKRGLSEE